jgi:hypothetical protein
MVAAKSHFPDSQAGCADRAAAGAGSSAPAVRQRTAVALQIVLEILIAVLAG